MSDRSRYRVALGLTVVLWRLSAPRRAGSWPLSPERWPRWDSASCCCRAWRSAPGGPGRVAFGCARDAAPCLTCEPALVRAGADPPHDIDVLATTDALISLVEEGRIQERRGDVALADVLDLLCSELKYTVVSYLELPRLRTHDLLGAVHPRRSGLPLRRRGRGRRTPVGGGPAARAVGRKPGA